MPAPREAHGNRRSGIGAIESTSARSAITLKVIVMPNCCGRPRVVTSLAARGGALSIVMICVAAHAAWPSLFAAPQHLVGADATTCSPAWTRTPRSTSPFRRRPRPSVASACRLDTGCDVIRGMPAVKLRWFASSIQTVAGWVDKAHVGVPDASITYVGTADDRRAARSRLGPSTGGRGEQAQPGCLNYALAAKRGLCDDVGVPTQQASSAPLTLSGACPAKRAR
jgi:hypothetical protein